jgi:hypothetical protein
MLLFARAAERDEGDMKRTWPIIDVVDVQLSSRWYRELLGCSNNHPDDQTFDL